MKLHISILGWEYKVAITQCANKDAKDPSRFTAGLGPFQDVSREWAHTRPSTVVLAGFSTLIFLN